VSAEQTAHQRAEEIRSRLDSASRHKGAFVANMSHELRTPLNAVMGFADLLASGAAGPLNSTQRDYVEDIGSSARHLLTLINDILDLAKLEAGQLSLTRELVGVAAALREVVRRVTPVAAARGIAVELGEVDDDLVVTADQQRLMQIADGLISNAVKFTPDGGRVSVAGRGTQGELVLVVRDTGIGVLPEQRQAIFEPFHQGRQLSDRQVPEGTGVGLSLVKGLVELHGGHVSVHGAGERGSEFVVTLPGARLDAARVPR
jgi:signal transduction histidine kinase